MALLVLVMVRFNEKSNPQPSRTTHNTALEIAWTVIPILILVAIAIPSFRLLFAQYDFPKADLTITATGSQWYWTYDYPDQGIHFDSIIVPEAELKPGQPRLLTVDHEVVVPVNKNVIVQVKANDVIHDWAMPSFGIKLDAVPGRLQKTWFRAEKHRHLPRPMLGAVRPQPCLHADRRYASSPTRSLPTGSPRPSPSPVPPARTRARWLRRTNRDQTVQSQDRSLATWKT